MKPLRIRVIICLVISVLLSGCSVDTSSQTATVQVVHLESTSQSSPIPTTDLPPASLSAEAIATLNSLRQVDEYPLYSMQYVGKYTSREGATSFGVETELGTHVISLPQGAVTLPTWGCSLFAALGDEGNRLYGRNFDWEFSPSLLLFTNPPDGYASVSMVDIAYLGFAGSKAQGLTELPLEELHRLLESPGWPFDGMNSQGLAIGMAAVPAGNMRPDPGKPTIDSLMIIREVLDQAADVGQALDIFTRYNIEMGGGPPLHYLLADVSGEAALVEFYQGEMQVMLNHEPYHLATNFLLSATGSPDGQCWRYDLLKERLSAEQGVLSSAQGVELLSGVAQDNTQWSVVYDMTSLEVRVAPGQQYDQVYIFSLK